ncbi:GNAT family N-acetyltransferase [Flavobacterium sp. LS1R47]|uniref:GNAT family N-acetyltransferase n=1 Tax=Flavobacterium frigoritolerans TaxID=2987686 RepID=A0A9X2ZQZ5_9FLAO|nr:GNAT family N-acetyltransferase [Flavobacterium frigoritolerans]MCV9932333.1 GNAT family N-acetyltransferase [Flavobacterium frigoritolerans]
MKIVQVEFLSLEQKETLLQLWNNEYPKNLNHDTIHDFDLYLNSLSNVKHHFLIDDENIIRGWAFAFLRDNEDWFAIIIDNQIQGRGKGSLLIEELKKNKNNLNGWVIDHDNEIKNNKMPYKSPLAFYVKNGFTICAENRIENEKISAVKINWKR